MKMTALQFPVLVSFLIFGAANAEAPKHRRWDQDQAAYRSYDSRGPGRHFPQVKRTFAPIRFRDDYLVSTLKLLTGEKDPVLANRGNAAGRLAAREFMRKEFESFGYTVREHAYRSGANLIAERAGKSGKFLIVSAHYDSVNNAGADDDGSGVVAMLATARALRADTLKHGVRFVAFDEEERGLVGSRAYVKDLVQRGEKASILGDVHFEMSGWNEQKDGKFHVISCGKANSDFMVGAFVQAVRNLENGTQITEACTQASDHASFWQAGIPAVVTSENFFGGDSNPCYHQKCDTVARMHPDYFVKVAEVEMNAVRLLVAEP